MAIQIVNAPLNTAFSGNPIRIKVRGTNYLLNEGVCSSLQLVFSQMDSTVGHKFTLAFLGMIIEFELRSVSDDSGTYITPAGGGMVLADWVDTVHSNLSMNYYLNRDYVLEFDSTTITITAKLPGSKYDLVFDPETVVGIAAGTDVSGVDRVFRQGYGIAMLFGKLEEFSYLAEEIKSPDDDGYVTFEVSEYVRSVLDYPSSPRFKFPDTVGDGFYVDAIINFQACFAEKYDGVIRGIYTGSPPYYTAFFAVPGGLSFEKIAKQDIALDEWWGVEANTKKVLSWHPGNKKTTLLNQESIYYNVIWPDTGGTLVTKKCVRVYYTDGTYEDFELNMVNIRSMGYVELQAGFQFLDLTLQEEKTVSAWKVWMKCTDEDDNTVVYSPFQFVVDPVYREFERIFKFKNSFGVFENFRCTGKIEETPSYDIDKISRVTEEGENAKNPPVMNSMIRETQSFKAVSGFLTRDELSFMRDFELSTEIYELIGENVYPIVLTGKKRNSVKDGSNNVFLEFEYERAYTDEFYSK